MSPAAILFILLFALSIGFMVRCWWRPDPNYVGWLLLAFFSLFGAIIA